MPTESRSTTAAPAWLAGSSRVGVGRRPWRYEEVAEVVVWIRQWAASLAAAHRPHPTAEDRCGDGFPSATAVAWAQLPAPDHPAAGSNGSGPPRDSRTRVRELVARERATGIRLHARDVAAAAGISERRAYELLRAVRAEEQQP